MQKVRGKQPDKQRNKEEKLMKCKNNDEDVTDLMLYAKRLKLLQLRINFWGF